MKTQTFLPVTRNLNHHAGRLCRYRQLLTLYSLPLAFVFFSQHPLYAEAVPIIVDQLLEENFDIGTEADAELPPGWRIDSQTGIRTVGDYAVAQRETDLRGGNSLASNAKNGIYNFGAGIPAEAEDRAPGFVSASATTSLRSGNLYLHLLNDGDDPIAGFSISYAIEKYRNGSNVAGFSIQLYHSTNGTDWVSAGEEFHTWLPPDEDNIGYDSAPEVTIPLDELLLPVAVATGKELYLAWNYSVATGSNAGSAQALAIDDVRITALESINFPPQLTLSTEECHVLPGEEVLVTSTASDPDDDPVVLSVSSTNIVNVAGLFDPVSGLFAWRPTAIGQYDVVFTASDGRGGVTQKYLKIHVLNLRRPLEGGFVWHFDDVEPAALKGTLGVSAGEIMRTNSAAQVDFISSASPSSGYEGASGGGNGATCVRQGEFGLGSSPCLEFTIYPQEMVEVALQQISFGTRSTSTGPQTLILYSSSDNFEEAIAQFEIEAGAGWILETAALDLAFNRATAFRLYAADATTSTGSTANWRVDDLKLLFTTCLKCPCTVFTIK